MCHHAVERRQLTEDLLPFARAVSNANAGPVARREHARTAQRLAGPLALHLYFRVARECGTGLRQAEIDGVAIVVGGKAQLQADGGLSHGALDRVLALLDRAREGFGPAQSVEDRPPSAASDCMIRPRATSAISR